MKALIVLTMLITACTSTTEKKVIDIPMNTTDTVYDPKGTIYNLQKSPTEDTFHFGVDTRIGGDTLIIKNDNK